MSWRCKRHSFFVVESGANIDMINKTYAQFAIVVFINQLLFFGWGNNLFIFLKTRFRIPLIYWVIHMRGENNMTSLDLP